MGTRAIVRLWVGMASHSGGERGRGTPQRPAIAYAGREDTAQMDTAYLSPRLQAMWLMGFFEKFVSGDSSGEVGLGMGLR